MKVRLAVLMKLHDSDVLGSNPEFPAQIRSQFVEGLSKVDDGIVSNLFRV